MANDWRVKARSVLDQEKANLFIGNQLPVNSGSQPANSAGNGNPSVNNAPLTPFQKLQQKQFELEQKKQLAELQQNQLRDRLDVADPSTPTTASNFINVPQNAPIQNAPSNAPTMRDFMNFRATQQNNVNVGVNRSNINNNRALLTRRPTTTNIAPSAAPPTALPATGRPIQPSIPQTKRWWETSSATPVTNNTNIRRTKQWWEG